MKAIIEFELCDNLLNKDELKQQLILKIANLCEDWIKGEAILNIDFEYTNDENNKCNPDNNRDNSEILN